MSSAARLLIAGTHSGVGKTSVAVGLMAALSRTRAKVQPFKVGPDYLDPGFHAAACEAPSWTLDSWMLGPAGVKESFARGMVGSEVAIIEGMMGLHDGASPASEAGSTAEVSKLLRCPVILVIDAAGLARSAGALVHGYRDFDPSVQLAGVVANRVSGQGHLDYLRPSIEALGLPLLGGLPPEEGIRIPERQLGLVTAGELQSTGPLIERLADWATAHLNLAQILELASAAPALDLRRTPEPYAAPSGARIAVARDAAFCFYYPDNLALLQRSGAELVAFSPLTDSELPSNIQGLYLGGGYPEMHASELSENRRMRRSIRDAIESGLPTFAECGGFMYLSQEIAGGKSSHEMVGVVPGRVVMEKRLQAIGYREVTLVQDTALGSAGDTARGHEFRYSRHEGEIPAQAAALLVGEHCVGFATENLLASYVHLHFGSNPPMSDHFVQQCARRR